LKKATTEAETEKQHLLDEAREAAEALSTKRQETLRNEAHNLSQSISNRTQDEVFAISRKALTDLATTSLEIQMSDIFTDRIRSMDEAAKTSLGEALTTASEPAFVHSAYDLPEAQRTRIQTAINETFSADIPLRFETAPDVISGIELSTNGQKVSWSIAEYLTSLEKSVGELLKEKDKVKSK
jgi:F-type H+-transporting ATPase subunit b